MTHRADVARGRDIVARWCNLAERRLEYLTELFETGRWRRFHSERAFLENIQGSQGGGRNLARSADARGVARQFRHRHVMARTRRGRRCRLATGSASTFSATSRGRHQSSRTGLGRTRARYFRGFSGRAGAPPRRFRCNACPGAGAGRDAATRAGTLSAVAQPRCHAGRYPLRAVAPHAIVCTALVPTTTCA